MQADPGDAMTTEPAQDGSVRIELSDDLLTATGVVTAPRGGGAAIDPAAVRESLRNLGVVHGLADAVIDGLPALTADASVLLAAGRAPQHGQATRFEMLVSGARPRAPKVGADGLVDFHELGDFPSVQPGQPLMRRHLPTPGVDGIDLRGAPLPAEPGADLPFDPGLPGVAPSPDDANLLLASVAGLPVQKPAGAMVEQVLRLAAVNMASGNIHFVGSVEIQGEVSPGMKVEASGDILVRGLVDGGHLDAGGNIAIAGGLIAHGSARAKMAVSVRFVENAAVQAGTTLVVEQRAMHSELEAMNQLSVGLAAGGRGGLVGGVARATLRVAVANLGAPAGGVTRVQVGASPALLARQHALARELAHEKEEAEKLERIVHHLESHGDPKHLLDKVKAAWRAELAEWAHLIEEKTEFEHFIEHLREASVSVQVRVAGEVELAFGRLTARHGGGLRAGCFELDGKGRIVYREPGGEALVL